MARTLSSDILTQIQQEGVRVVHLLKLDTSTAIKATNHVKNLTYDSNTYEAGGNFLDIEDVQETGVVEYSSMNITLNNVTDTVRNIFTAQNYVNKTATIYVAFLNSSENIIDAYEFFNGSIVGASIVDAKESFSIKIELASQFKNWDIKKGRRFTQASQDTYLDKNSLGTDKGLSFAHTTSQNVRWNR